MTETSFSETPKTYELVHGKYDVRFEPGVHSFPYSDLVLGQPASEEIVKKYREGDLTVHAWNPEVAKRMAQYKPKVLGLDGLAGGAFKRGLPWFWLPGSPKEMTGSDSIYVVGGDLIHQHFIFDERGNIIGWNKVGDYAADLGTEGAGHILLPPILTFLLSRAPKEKISRRAVLKAGLGLGALSLASLIGKVAPVAASYSKSTDELPGKVIKFVKPIAKSTWLDGRTALVTTKTIDAMEKLNLPAGSKGSVVMGFPHAWEGVGLLGDKNARAEALRKYATEFANDVYPAIDEDVWEANYKMGELKDLSEKSKRDLLMAYVILNFVSTIIYEVKEPQSYYSRDPQKDTSALVKTVDLFVSPEVMNAVSSLCNRDQLDKLINNWITNRYDIKSPDKPHGPR